MDTQQQNQYNVLILGDSCEDVYIFGECPRLSSEAPVPVLEQKKVEVKFGMVANVKSNFENMSPKSKVNYLTHNPKLSTKTRFVDIRSGQQVMRHDILQKIPEIDIKDIPKEKYDAIIISDYDMGFISKKTIDFLKSINSPIFVDTKKRNLSCYSGCVVKINEFEEKKAYNKKGCDLIVTVGSKGAKWSGKKYTTDVVEAHDVCGAGDVFLASLVARWLETKNLEMSIKTANKCASLSVTKIGCYSLSCQEYEDLKI
tara:strand:- start:1350 stop:2120 length:771 start_codon:yes stop_codon:yes gene_type:complete